MSYLEDIACDIGAGDHRQVKGRTGDAPSDPDVEVVECAGSDPNDDLTRPWRRVWYVLYTEHLGATVFAQEDGPHRPLKLGLRFSL